MIPHLSEILRTHEEGFSPRQIVAMAAAPGIELKLSERAVQRIVADHEKQATAQAGTPGQ